MPTASYADQRTMQISRWRRAGGATLFGSLALAAALGACSPAEEGPTAGEPPRPEPTASSSTPSAPATHFTDTGDDGESRLTTVIAGVDVVPGIYRTVNAQADDGRDGGSLFDGSCKFGQYSDADPGIDTLIAGGTADGGHPTVTLSEGHLFRTQRCGSWELVDPADLFDTPESAPTTIVDGMWLVGEDFRPGTYRTQETFSTESDVDDRCIWEVDSTWTDWDGETLEVETADGHGEVTLETGQQLVSTGCGTWHLVTETGATG